MPEKKVDVERIARLSPGNMKTVRTGMGDMAEVLLSSSGPGSSNEKLQEKIRVLEEERRLLTRINHYLNELVIRTSLGQPRIWVLRDFLTEAKTEEDKEIIFEVARGQKISCENLLTS